MRKWLLALAALAVAAPAYAQIPTFNPHSVLFASQLTQAFNSVCLLTGCSITGGLGVGGQALLNGGATINSGLQVNGTLAATGNITFSGTGALQLPSGTTGQEPSPATAGMLRWNSTTGRSETYSGSAWQNHVRLSGDTMTGGLTINQGGLTVVGGGATVAGGETISSGGLSVSGNAAITSGGLSVSGGDVTGTSTATGATLSRTFASRFADSVNLKDYAKGDVVGISSCTIAAATGALSCPGASFTSADVGKSYYLQGSGTAGTPQIGTITGFTDATHVTLSLVAVTATPQFGIYDPPEATVSVNSGGSGYTAASQTLTITGGTCTTQPTVNVTVSGGAVTAVTGMANPGVCTSAPPSGSATSGGDGTGATFNTASYQAAGKFLYGTDDTSAIQSALSYAISQGKALTCPAGTYWLASQSSAITLNNIAIHGQGRAGYNFPYTGGCTWLIGDKTTVAFSGIQGVDWDGVNLWYPEQDNSQTTPVVFPATFDNTNTGHFTNFTFRNSRVLNAYDLFSVTNASASSGAGRLAVENVRAYCVDKCFTWATGDADVLEIGSSNQWGSVAFDNQAVNGPANLAQYTATSGEFMHIDIGAGGYTSLDGLKLTSTVVHGMRYGIRLVSGTLHLANIASTTWDAVQTPLSVEGTSKVTESAWTGGEIYSTDVYDLTQSSPVFAFTSTNNASDISITGIRVSFALGHVLSDTGNGILSLVFYGNKLSSWGQSSTAGTYYGVRWNASNSGHHNIGGNLFDCNSTANTISGILTTSSGGQVDINGNTFRKCANNLVTQGSAGVVLVAGNTSSGTTGNAINDTTSGVSTVIVKKGVNFWDKTLTTRVPTLSSCGTTPSIASPSDNFDGKITVGTGTVTACTLTFTSALPFTPRAVVLTPESTGAGTLAVTAESTTAFTIGTSATSMAGIVIDYHVVQ